MKVWRYVHSVLCRYILVSKRYIDFICWMFPEPLSLRSYNINSRVVRTCSFWLCLFPHWRSFWSHRFHPSVSFAMPIYLCLFFGSLLPTFSITSAFPLTSPHYYSFPPFLSSHIRPFFLKPQFALSASLLLFQSLPLSFPKALPIYKEPNIASLIPATPHLNFFFLRFPISILDFPSLAFNFL